MTMGQHLSVSITTLHYDTERSNFVLIVVVGLAAVAVMAARVGAPQPVHHFCFLLLLFAFFFTTQAAFVLPLSSIRLYLFFAFIISFFFLFLLPPLLTNS